MKVLFFTKKIQFVKKNSRISHLKKKVDPIYQKYIQ